LDDFSKEDLRAFFDEAAQYGLFPVGPIDFEQKKRLSRGIVESNTFAWFALQKHEDMPGSTEAPSSYGIKNGARLAFLSTWNQPCGIATHTGYMIDGLKKAVGKDGGWLRDILCVRKMRHP